MVAHGWTFILLLIFSLQVSRATESDTYPSDRSLDVKGEERNQLPVDQSSESENYENDVDKYIRILNHLPKRSFGEKSKGSLEGYEKRRNSMLHFGKRPSFNSMLHFGKRPSLNSLVHFGARPNRNSMLHFGKRPSANSMLHFGKRPSANSMLHFGKRPSANSMLHFGKRMANSRSGGSYGKRPQSSILHFGKRTPGNSLIHFGKRSIPDSENKLQSQLKDDLKKSGSILHFGKLGNDDSALLDDSSVDRYSDQANLDLTLPLAGYGSAFNIKDMSKEDVDNFYDAVYDAIFQNEQRVDDEEQGGELDDEQLVDEAKRSFSRADLYNRQVKNSILHFG